MKKIVIIYGSCTDNTRNAAEMIGKELSDFSPEIIDVSKATVDHFTSADHLFLGTSTWGLGDLQDDWDGFLPKLKSVNLSGKPVSLFGLGDSDSYSDTFVDGMGALYEFFSDKGCKIVGSAPASDYSFDASKAEQNGEFVGLPLNADGEDHLTEKRIKNWIEGIKPSL